MHCSFSKNPQTRLLSHSWLPRVCTDTSAPCLDASAPTRLPRRVCADASAPTRPRRGVCTDASAPTGPGRAVFADASTPRGLHRRVCADASAPTRLRRCVCSGASKYGFSLKNFDSARDLLKKLEKTSSEITTFAKNDHPYRSCGISAVDLRSLRKWKIAPKSSIPFEAS